MLHFHFGLGASAAGGLRKDPFLTSLLQLERLVQLLDLPSLQQTPDHTATPVRHGGNGAVNNKQITPNRGGGVGILADGIPIINHKFSPDGIEAEVVDVLQSDDFMLKQQVFVIEVRQAFDDFRLSWRIQRKFNDLIEIRKKVTSMPSTCS